MYQRIWDRARKSAEEVGSCFADLLNSKELELLHKRLAALKRRLGDNYEVNLELSVNVTHAYEPRAKDALSLVGAVLGARSRRPEFTADMHTLSMYRIVRGGYCCVVPEGRCPQCWRVWPDMFVRPCPRCNLKMGETCQLVMSAGECPVCEDGHISREEPTCSGCAFNLSRSLIEWVG